MKKIIGLILVVLVILTVLFSCKSELDMESHLNELNGNNSRSIIGGNGNLDNNDNEISKKPTINGSNYNDPLGRLNFNKMEFYYDIEEYYYTEFISYDEYLAVYDWLESLGFDVNNEKDNEWIRSNFNKILLKAVANEIISDFLNSSLTRWGGSTHNKMMEKIFYLLGNNDPVCQFFENMKVNYTYGNNNSIQELKKDKSAKQALINLARQPDYDEPKGGRHGYVVYKKDYTPIGVYYPGGDGSGPVSISARTRIEDYYSAALNAYTNDDNEGTIRWLAFAIHYLMDVGNTLHSTGILDPQHKAFEDYIDTNFDNNPSFHATSMTIRDVYTYFRHNFFFPVNELAYTSADGWIPPIRLLYYDVLKNMQTGYYSNVIAGTLPVTEQYVAALLEQFYTDARAIDGLIPPTSRSERVIVHGKKYRMKNFRTGLYASVKNSGLADQTPVIQMPLNGQTNQVFEAIYYKWKSKNEPGGYYNFHPVHTTNGSKRNLSFLNGDCVSNNQTNSNHQRFKPTYLEHGKYRVMLGDSDYYQEILRVHDKKPISNVDAPGQVLCRLAFNPNSLNHYWIFEEVQ